MTNEQQKAKELAVLLTAFADGKPLEYMIGSSSWSNYTDLDIRKFGMNIANGYKFRIKPETKRIALIQQDLIDRELSGKTMSLIYNKTVIHISTYSEKRIYLANGEIEDYDSLMEYYTFLDGTPCYKEVESE